MISLTCHHPPSTAQHSAQSAQARRISTVDAVVLRAIAFGRAALSGCVRMLRLLASHGAQLARRGGSMITAVAGSIREVVVTLARRGHLVVSKVQRQLLVGVLAVQLAVSELVAAVWRVVSELLLAVGRAVSRVIMNVAAVAARVLDAASAATLRAARALGHAAASTLVAAWRRLVRPTLSLLFEWLLQPLALVCGRQWPIIAVASSCFSVRSFARAGFEAAGTGGVWSVLPALLGAGVSLSVSLLLSGLVLGLPALQVSDG